MVAMTATHLEDNERLYAWGLAIVMHAVFLALLIFGVSWQKKQPSTAMVVDLWTSLPSTAPEKAEPRPEPPVAKPEPPPPPPKPEPKVAKPEPVKPVPKAAPKVEEKAAPKPDIALKDKLEKERVEKERKTREATEAKQREEEKLKRAVDQERQAKEADAKRRVAEQEDAQRRLAQQQASAQAKIIDEYKARISERIRRFIVMPPNVSPNASVEFDIVVLPGGEVLGAKLKRSSNSIAAYDSAVERAILRAQPLPLPPDPSLMKEFRELNLTFRPDKAGT